MGVNKHINFNTAPLPVYAALPCYSVSTNFGFFRNVKNHLTKQTYETSNRPTFDTVDKLKISSAVYFRL